MTHKTDDDIRMLQQYEFTLQNILAQKQQIQQNIAEIENALAELKTADDAYLLSGNVLVKKSSKTIIESLNEKKELAEVRLNALTKQEKSITDKAAELQKHVLEDMKASDKDRKKDQ